MAASTNQTAVRPTIYSAAAAGRQLVSELTNCEDLLLNFVAAAAVAQRQPAAGSSLGRLPHALWAQPSRRLDLSSLSGVALSKKGKHEGGLDCLSNADKYQSVCHSLPECDTLWAALLQPRGRGAWRSLPAGMATCCRRRRYSGTAATLAPRGAGWRARCAGCRCWAASTCELQLLCCLVMCSSVAISKGSTQAVTTAGNQCVAARAGQSRRYCSKGTQLGRNR